MYCLPFSLLDERAKRMHEHKTKSDSEIVTPVHLNFRLTADTDFKDLLQVKLKEEHQMDK